MTVERIYISPERGAPQTECDQITLVQGMGAVGDRNFGVNRHPGQNLTLIEAEEIEQFCTEQGRPVDLSLTRRNLVTRGIRLNNLVNREFFIGPVKLRGVELCEPCSIVGELMSSPSLPTHAAIKHWVGRGGLRVDILNDGEITRGARLKLTDPA